MQEQVVGFQLSLQQRHLWRAQQESAAFRAQCVVAIEGELSLKTLREALRRVVRRHEILRTAFCYLPGIKTPVQIINDDAPYAWGVEELSDARDESALEQLCERERETVFDPERGPVLRALLVKGGARRLLILTLPALCADARTLTNLVGELARACDAAVRGGEDDEEVVQYLQFSEWQNELLEEAEAADGREFWRRRADGQAPTLPFERNPADASAPYRPSRVTLALDPDLSAHVREAARACGLALDKFLLAAWQTLLWRLSGQAHVVVRAMFEGRKFEELSGALGLFAKWPPIAQRFEREQSFREVVAQVQEAAHENHAWLEYFTGEDEGTPEESARGVGFEFSAWPEAFAAGGVTFALERQYACCERFKLNLSCVESGGALAVQFYYDPARLSCAEVERLADGFRVLLESAARAPDSLAVRLDVLGAEERERLLFEFNRTESPAPPAPCAHMMFERQVESTPARVAVNANGRSLTYAELNARANQLARYLRSLGVGPEVPVALFVERGLEMVVALVGVLKAGGAYVPLDTSYPRERLAYMLSDSRARFVLTQEHLAGALPEGTPRAIRLDADWPEVERESAENPEYAVNPDNLAYVIYTSGSTGVPKGVMVTHSGLANYLHWARAAYLREESQLGSYVHSPVGFDLTVTSLYCPLLAGQSVELIAEEEGIEGFAAALRRGSTCGLLKITPAHLDLLARSIPAEEAATTARAFVIGGEALLGDSLSFWREHAPGTRLINEYGPTETVVGCCVYEVGEGERLEGVVPIGRPVANTRMYVL
ncbi:MAG: non-ribosomal peptide synthetase, partial [Pyrinomonadaceae bacterium]